MKNRLSVLMYYFTASLLLIAASCSTEKKANFTPLDTSKFVANVDGKPISLFNLENKNGLMVQITNYGGRMAALWVPDRNGNFADILTGYDTISGFLNDTNYFNGIIGRYANRIANGKFALDGVEYTLPINSAPNTLHGGKRGFDKKIWDVVKNTKDSLVLTYTSVAGEEGFPGTLKAQVIYSLNDSNELRIDYSAETDAPTVVNLTSHGFYNLAGYNDGDILGHILMINADKYTPVDSNFIPTGEIADVTGTPFDFRTPTPVGARIGEDNIQLNYGMGYDHNWVLNKMGDEISLACRIEEPVSGRVMEIYTDQPGIQVYSGNFLNGTVVGKNGVTYQHRQSICMETQHYPDSPNHENFPSTVLRPGEKYQTSTIEKFLVK